VGQHDRDHHQQGVLQGKEALRGHAHRPAEIGEDRPDERADHVQQQPQQELYVQRGSEHQPQPVIEPRPLAAPQPAA